MDIKTLEQIEMKNDGHDQERFQQVLKKVSTVPKSEIDKAEKRLKDEKKKAKA